MRQSTIQYVPLRDSGKISPYRAAIPDEVMVAAEPPSFAEAYGQFIFLILCVAIAAYFIQPELEKRWDITSSDDEWKFIAVYIGYGVFCLAIFIFFIQPALGLPTLDLSDTRFHVVAFFSGLGANFKFAQYSSKSKL